MKKRLIALFLITAILMLQMFTGFCVSAEETSYEDATTLFIKNSDLKIDFNDEGRFVVTDLASQKTFASSVPTENDSFSAASYKKLASSELAIHYYIKSEKTTSDNTNIAYSSDANKEVVSKGDSICIKYDFTECKVKLNVLYSLKNSYLSASIDFKSFKEYGKFAVSNIEFLPGFGAGDSNDSGYMFVPDGSGALIDFNNGEKTQYNADVYGAETSEFSSLLKTQKETVRMPVFGAVNNDTAVFGIIDSGDAIASINAVTGHSENNYNMVYSSVNKAHTYSKEMFSNSSQNASTAYHKTNQVVGFSKYTVLYRFLTGAEANYSGMAGAYREYLVGEKGLKKRVSSPVLNVDLIGAIDIKKNFLGFTYYKPIALTTYKQAQKIEENLKKSGIEQLAIRYIGWNNDGISNESVLKKLKVMRALGGNSGFKNLNSALNNSGTQITYDIEFLKFYKGAKKYKVLNPFNEVVTSFRYLRSVYAQDLDTRVWYQLTPSRWTSVTESLVSSAEKLKLENISVNALTSSIYSDFRLSDPTTREETKKIAVNNLESIDKNFVISGDKVNAYAFPYVDKIYASPCYTSGYYTLYEEVPFYQMALHGYVDLTAEAQFTAESRDINYLKAVETGSQLLYTGIYSGTDMVTDTDYDYLYGTNYKLWSKDAAKKYAEYQPLLQKIYDSEIVSHIKISKNVFKTTYANGVSVIVNYNGNSVQVNGMTIAAYDFCEVTK